MKFVFLIFSLCVFKIFNSFGQTNKDTLFYNYLLELTSIKDSISYYGLQESLDKKRSIKHYYYQSGSKFSSQAYLRQKRHGAQVFYHENGLKESEGQFQKNKQIGEWKYYDFAGKLARTSIFNRRAKLIAEYHITDSNKKVYTFTKNNSHFGNYRNENEAAIEMGRFIDREIIRPEIVETYAECVVGVSFLISPSGKLEELDVFMGVHPLIDNAVLDVIRKMPNWTPAYYKKEAVYSSFEIVVSL